MLHIYSCVILDVSRVIWMAGWIENKYQYQYQQRNKQPTRYSNSRYSVRFHMLRMREVFHSIVGQAFSATQKNKVVHSVVSDACSMLWIQVGGSNVWGAFTILWMYEVAHHAAGEEYWVVPRWGLPKQLKSAPRSVAIHPTSVCTPVRADGWCLPRYYCCCCGWGILPADCTPWCQLIVDTTALRWVALLVPLARVSGLQPGSPCMGSTRHRDRLHSPEVLGYGRIGRDRAFWLPWSSFPRPPVGVPEIRHLGSPKRAWYRKGWIMTKPDLPWWSRATRAHSSHFVV